MSPRPDQDVAEIKWLLIQLRLDIENGENRVAAKNRMLKELEARGRRDLGELLFTYESVFRERAGMSDTPTVVVHGNVANLNLGEQLGNITVVANAIQSQDGDGAAMARALRQLAEGIEADPDLSIEKKKEALETVEAIGEQAKLPKDQRKPGIFKSTLSYLPTLLSATAASMKIWEAVGPTVISFFH